MTNPVLERIMRDLERRGDRLEAQAIQAVIRAYGDINLAQLIALLRAATETDSPLARVKYMDDLMDAFDKAAASLAEPPDTLARTVREAVQSGVTGTTEMFAASQVVTDAFTVPATLQLRFREHAIARMNDFWALESPRFRGEIQGAVYDGLERGQSIDQITKRIKDRAGVSRSRAALIARTEVARSSAFAAEQSQREAGIEKYAWRTASDKRVRPAHAALDGRVFSWDKPPPGGFHPGQDFQCRCIAIAVLPKS